MTEPAIGKSSKRRRLDISPTTCCFCFEKFSDTKTTLNPNKFENLLNICKLQSDEISQSIVSKEAEIRSGQLELCYHKVCRTKFIRSCNHEDVMVSACGTELPKFTRSQQKCGEFDWKRHCFICGEQCSVKHKNKWSKVQGSIDETSKLYMQLLEIAQYKNDNVLQNRLLSSKGDLVAVEARYHRKKGCLAKLLVSVQRIQENDDQKTSEGQFKSQLISVCEMLMCEYQNSIEEKQVFEYNFLYSKYKEIFESVYGNNESIPSGRQVKKTLKSLWSKIQFIKRKGLSDLVCSKDIGFDEAVSKLVNLEKSFESIKEEEENINMLSGSFFNEDSDESSIIHQAATILRNRILKMSGIKKEYYSSSELSLDVQKDFLDPLLFNFVIWLSGNEGDNSAEIDRKVVSISSDLTAMVKPIVTPKHLGLTVYLHHLYGSKKLIDDLNVHGYTLPYSEVLHFLTSAATYMSTVQQKTPSGAIVPANLLESTEGIVSERLLFAAADNWDHIENTLSGKGSTHAMTSILISSGTSSKPMERFPRVQQRSFDTDALPGGGLAQTLVYQKPSARPSPKLNPPVQIAEIQCRDTESVRLFKLRETMYHIGREKLLHICDDRAVDKFPPWSVFQSVSENDVITEPAEITFNPIIMASPTDFSTIYTVLKRIKEQMNALGQTVCPVVFDMGLLTKVLEIIWARPSEFDGVVPIEGGMHFMMALFGGIGYIYGDAGLKDLLVESDQFGPLTASHILSGKDFDRALKAILMVDEALNRRFLQQFYIWAEKNSKDIPPALFDKLKSLDSNWFRSNGESVEGITSLVEADIKPLIELFRSEGRHNSPLFKFWDDYLNEVSLPLKMFLASSRHGKWDLNMYAKTKLLPFLFTSNRTVYSKFMTYQVLALKRIPDQLLQCFNRGLFVSKLTRGSFNAVWNDYVLEVTENKALKSSGGIIGITHNDKALGRWFLSRPVTARYADAYSPNKDPDCQTKKHHSDSKCHTKTYNEAVSSMLNLFNETFIDPFSLTNPPSKLVNFATGVEVSEDIETSLLNCFDTGKNMLTKFISERLTEESQKCFFEPMARPNVKTMGKSTGRLAAKATSNFSPINGEEMYLRLLAINAFKKVPLQRVLPFENSPVPLGLFTDDGVMLSNKKSDFLDKLENISGSPCSISSIELPDCILFDGMGVVQMLQPTPGVKLTFRDMVSRFWRYILFHSNGISCVHVVFDRYIPNSLKGTARRRRGEKISVSTPVVMQYNMPIPDWKKLLSSSRSKAELTKMYSQYLTENCQDMLSDNQEIYISGGIGDHVFRVCSHAIYYHSLSNQEEADTRLLLHLMYAKSAGVSKAVVFSPDTDVLVLLLHHFQAFGMDRIYFRTGRKAVYTDMTRYIPVHFIHEQLSVVQRTVLLPVYCITGCDTCSSFFGIGKKKAFQIMKNQSSKFTDLSDLGASRRLTHRVKSAAVTFIGLLYGSSTCVSVNSLRASLVVERSKTKPRKLPPTDDSLSLHLLRCLYQLIIWRSALIENVVLPDPIEFGYEIDQTTGMYVPLMMTQPAAPPELLSDLVCKCSNVCRVNCPCSKNEQPCTKACVCEGSMDGEDWCNNLFTTLADVTDGDDEYPFHFGD